MIETSSPSLRVVLEPPQRLDRLVVDVDVDVVVDLALLVPDETLEAAERSSSPSSRPRTSRASTVTRSWLLVARRNGVGMYTWTLMAALLRR